MANKHQMRLAIKTIIRYSFFIMHFLTLKETHLTQKVYLIGFSFISQGEIIVITFVNHCFQSNESF